MFPHLGLFVHGDEDRTLVIHSLIPYIFCHLLRPFIVWKAVAVLPVLYPALDIGKSAGGCIPEVVVEVVQNLLN